MVGKICFELGVDGSSALVRPAPLIGNDRSAADSRFLTEASELMPWAEGASMLAYGGPLRFTLHAGQGRPGFVLTASAQTPAGYSVSSVERARFAPVKPARGLDGLFTLPDDLDGRYFVAAPRRHQMPSLRGDESFMLEVSGSSVNGRLPGLAIAATVEVYEVPRVVALAWDTIAVDASKRRISLVGRAVVEGPATLRSFAIASLEQLRAVDRGDSRPRSSAGHSSGPESMDRWPFGWAGGTADPSFDDTSLMNQTVLTAPDLGGLPATLAEETVDAGRADLPRLGDTPFASPPDANRTISMLHVAATPFEPGFAPAAVVPAADVLSTLTPDQEMAIQLKKMRDQLRSQGPGSSPASRAASDPKSKPKP